MFDWLNEWMIDDKVPGVVAAGWQRSAEQAQHAELPLKHRLRVWYFKFRWFSMCFCDFGDFEQTFMEALRAHEKVWPFLDPVDREQVPDYYDVIKYLQQQQQLSYF